MPTAWARRLTTAMDGMKEKMAQMPPEQRAKMEAMMARCAARGPLRRRRNPSTAAPAATKSASGHATSTRVSETARRYPRSARSSRKPRPYDGRLRDQQAGRRVFPAIAAPGETDHRNRHAGNAGVRGHPCPPHPLQRQARCATSEVTDVTRQTSPRQPTRCLPGFRNKSIGSESPGATS